MANIVQSVVELDLTVKETIGSVTSPNVVSDARLKVTYSNINEAIRHKITLSDGTTDFQIPFGGVTNAHIVEIYSDEEITLKVNDVGNVAMPILRFVKDSKTGFTSLFLSNAAGTPAHVDIYIAEKAS